MDNSVYITMSRELALFRDMDVTSNNIANANTTGFSSEHMLFNAYLTNDVNERNVNKMAFANDISTYRNTETGPIKPTGNSLDVAIQGDGYFAVETPLGTRYTRAGNFQIDGSGTLVTAEGNPVLDGNAQHIQFPDDTDTITIGEAGNIAVNDQEFATLGVYRFDNPQLLERLDNSMFKSEVAPMPADTARVVQGALEGSNVQSVNELTHMMNISRQVGDTAKFIEAMYDMQRKASNSWAQQS